MSADALVAQGHASAAVVAAAPAVGNVVASGAGNGVIAREGRDWMSWLLGGED